MSKRCCESLTNNHMPTFTYKGKDRTGAPIEQTIEAEDRFAVYTQARTEGHTVLSVQEPSVWQSGTIDKINQALSRVSSDELVMMTRNLGSMITAGLTVSRALSVIERQSTNPKLKAIIHDIVSRINKGDQFYESLADHPKVFNNLYVSMVRAGEESGNVAESLVTIATQLERSNNLKKKIKGAMIYPAIVITAMVVIGILMMIYVMPQVTGVFESLDTELPATTKTMIAISDFLVNYTAIALLSMVGAIGGFIHSLRTTWGKIAFSWVVTRLPIIGTLAKETNSARTARTLSSLLGSGVAVLQSLEITEEVLQNVFYKRIVHEATERVEKGTALSDTFIEHDNLYPVLVGEMILVGEETGQIANMLSELAEFYETEVERKTKDLSTIIEPVLMLVIGGSVGFFALALIAPIYSIGNSL